MARKKKAETVKKVEKKEEAAPRREISPEEQSVMDEQDRQRRIAECTSMVQQALQTHNCDLDITVILGLTLLDL